MIRGEFQGNSFRSDLMINVNMDDSADYAESSMTFAVLTRTTATG